MPIILGKNLNFCLTMISRPSLNHKNTATTNEDQDHSRTLTTTTTSSSSSTSTMYIKNYNSLYEFTTPNTTNTTTPPTTNENHSFSHSSDLFSSDSEHEPDIATAPTPDFATICASKRFFISSPGQSNSIIDSSSSSSPTDSMPENESEETGAGGVAVQTYSPDPYLDFRRSMQEMVEAHELFDVKNNWDRLHELLLCYLSLNPKSTHKFIVGAFADLLVSLMDGVGGGKGGGGGEGGCAGYSCN